MWMVRRVCSCGASVRRHEFVRPEMGFVATKGHDHRHRRTDLASVPIGEHRHHFAALPLEIKGCTTVLGVVVDHDGNVDSDLVACLHQGFVQR